MPSLLVPISVEQFPERAPGAPGGAASGPLQAFAAILAGAQAQGASGHTPAASEGSLLLQNGAATGVPSGGRAEVLGGAFLPTDPRASEETALASNPAWTSDAFSALPTLNGQAQAPGQQTRQQASAEGSSSNTASSRSTAQTASSPLSDARIVAVDVPDTGSAETRRLAPPASNGTQQGAASGDGAHQPDGTAASSRASLLPSGEGAPSAGDASKEGRGSTSRRSGGETATRTAGASGESKIVSSEEGSAKGPTGRPTPESRSRPAPASPSAGSDSDPVARATRSSDSPARPTPDRTSPSASRSDPKPSEGARTSPSPQGNSGGSSTPASSGSARTPLSDTASAPLDVASASEGKIEDDDSAFRVRRPSAKGDPSQASERSGSHSGSVLRTSEAGRSARDGTPRTGARPQRASEGDQGSRRRMNPQSADTGDPASDERRHADGSLRSRTQGDPSESRARQRTGRLRDGRSAHLQGSRQGAQQQAKRKAGASRSRSLSAAKASKPARSGSSLAPPPTDLALNGELSLEDTEDTWSSALAKAQQSAASTKDARGAGSTAPTQRSFPMAWIKAATQGPLRVSALSGGWKAVEMNLDEGDGTVTIKARRDQDKVAVSVGFSEPRMQAQATANARQIQEALQAQYETDVDLSFSDGDAGDSGDPRSETSGREPGAARSAPSETATTDESSQHTSRTGARREWVG